MILMLSKPFPFDWSYQGYGNYVDEFENLIWVEVCSSYTEGDNEKSLY